MSSNEDDSYVILQSGGVDTGVSGVDTVVSVDVCVTSTLCHEVT